MPPSSTRRRADPVRGARPRRVGWRPLAAAPMPARADRRLGPPIDFTNSGKSAKEGEAHGPGRCSRRRGRIRACRAAARRSLVDAPRDDLAPLRAGAGRDDSLTPIPLDHGGPPVVAHAEPALAATRSTPGGARSRGAPPCRTSRRGDTRRRRPRRRPRRRLRAAHLVPRLLLSLDEVDHLVDVASRHECAVQSLHARRPGGRKSMSPHRATASPDAVEDRREFVPDVTWKEMRGREVRLVRPVMTSTDGRCVARIRWNARRAGFCARRVIDSSISRRRSSSGPRARRWMTMMRGRWRCWRPAHCVASWLVAAAVSSSSRRRHSSSAAAARGAARSGGCSCRRSERPSRGETVAVLHLAHNVGERGGQPSWDRSRPGRGDAEMPS